MTGFPTTSGRPLPCTIRAPHTTLRCRAPAALARNTRRRFLPVTAAADGPGPQDAAAGPRRCVMIECDGGLMDVHYEGHRVAFNRAFEELGYGCANWAPAIYNDLLRMGDATGPGLVKTYYEVVGWPIMLPTKERPAFVDKVYNTKVRIFKDMVDKGEIPLRDGVAQFLDDALADGVRPVVLAGTASAPEDSTVSCAMLGMGPTRAFKMQVVYLGSPADVSAQLTASEDESEEDGEGAGMTMDQRIAAAQAQAKKTAAASFTRAVNLQTTWGVGMRMDPALAAGKERAMLASPSFVAAVLTTLQCSASDSVMVAASHSLMEAAKGAGMMVAGVPPSLAARGGYAAADAMFDGFGAGGGLTWRKTKAMLDARKS